MPQSVRSALIVKKVIYNGRTDHYYPSDSSENLEKGSIYTVVEERISGWHTEYIIAEVPSDLGFNSMWFQEPKYFEELKSAFIKEGEVDFVIIEDCVYDKQSHLIANFKEFMRFAVNQKATIDFSRNRLCK